MTRVTIYSAALVVFVAATAMTIASIFIPNWISWDVDGSTGHFQKTIGLHKSCTSVDNKCQHYPQVEDCSGTDRYFCSMWRSVGFMMSFSAVLELVTIVAYCVVLFGGKQKRETGWKILSLMLMMVGLVQCAAMAIVTYLYDNDDRFFAGWKLDKGWVLCTASWSIAVLSAGFISLSAFVLSPEGDYELIPSERNGR